MNDINAKNRQTEEQDSLLPNLSDAEEARKAFIAAEVFNRKY